MGREHLEGLSNFALSRFSPRHFPPPPHLQITILPGEKDHDDHDGQAVLDPLVSTRGPLLEGWGDRGWREFGGVGGGQNGFSAAPASSGDFQIEYTRIDLDSSTATTW